MYFDESKGKKCNNLTSRNSSKKLTISLILRNSFSIKFYQNAFSVQKLNQDVDTET